ncbi:RBBP9/YdeN family alpha/beta hydrolase [Silvimonas iriomotensis]|uniref:Alpha/beta hydrolase n=1 Tax=Silvimonas iriomotensis TaxID=449662 RepID=A0ABQ2PEV2_9NEIS|nr:alpha/beta hydrolase [Silvimonas iriomotensis]GGP24020.1 hypothetical protein GCM10010970_40200 [Silvimonas iriomotensis]
MPAPVLILPGLYCSGPQHWQSHWEAANPDFIRVEQADWETPHCADWVSTLDTAIAACAEPPVLVGHSLACTLIGKWAEQHQRPIKGALLVAPSDIEAPSYPEGTSGFGQMVTLRLPFPSIVVASSNDEYVTLPRARAFAANWGSEVVEVGPLGHINSSSNLGLWPEGFALLEKLRG